jgi:gliding motility-associated-like protein
MARTGLTSNFVTGVGPVIITQPVATLSLCNNATTGNTLTVNAVGQQLTYQWYSNTTNSTSGGTAISGATTATFTAPTTTLATTYYYVIVSSSCNNVSETSAVSTVNVNSTNWTKIYETTNPSRDGLGEIVYAAGFGKTGGAASSYNANFNRIRYRLENNVAGTLRWAEVSFDRLANITIADLQIPDLVNNNVIQTNVSNIEVSSNMPGVHTGNFSTGRLEFWNQNYGTNRSGLTPAGDANTFDWDDLLAGTTNGHGSFQIHNVSPEKEQTIFAWNMHRNGGPPEIGIGNAPTGHPDWTFNTSNGSGNFKVQIFVQEAPVITPNGSVATCVGTPVTLTASAGASYLWSNGATTQSISTANAGNYTVTVTQANGCNSTSLPKTVTITTPPTPSTITGTQEVCVGGATPFNVDQSGALAFNGSNNFIETASNINTLNITGDITLETWVKLNALPSDWVRIIGKGGIQDRTYGFWVASNGTLLWQIYGTGTDPGLQTSAALQAGLWYHIVATRTGNTHKIYINGVERASTTASITPASNTLPLTLGYSGYHTYLNGVLDEVRVWNVGRTLAQINDNKDIEIAPQSGLVAYYKFNQGIASANNTGVNTLSDNSGNAINGSLRNFTLTGNTSNWVSRSASSVSGTWNTSNASIATVNTLGVVTGVAAGNASITFTVAGSGGCPDVVSTRTITVNPLPIITYQSNSYSFERTKVITAIQPASTGATVTSYAISPALPTGLTFNTTTGIVSGTPSVLRVPTLYTVTATTEAGCTVTRTFTLSVFNAVVPSALSYAPASQTVRQGTAITAMVPSASGGVIASYSISPALPAGLTFNTSTGVVGGTLTAAQTGTVNYTITATNSGGSTTATVTLIFNTAPTDLALNTTSVAENEASGTAVGTLSATDADAGDTFTYSLVSGTGSTDNASFTIDGSTLKTAAVFDFETKTSYSVRVRVTDAGGLSFEKALTISVTNVNEAPTNISASASSVAENEASGTSVATMSATDVDAGDTFTYSLVAGTGDADNASFTIDGATLKTAGVFDFETKSSYSVRVRVTDAAGLSFEKEFTITVTDVNEAPTALALTGTSVLENAASGTAVGTLAGTDADAGDTHTYTLVSGTGSTDNASFTITGTTISTAAVFNFEAKNSYSVRVRVTDAGGLSFEKAFTITVTDVNEAPTLTAITDRRVYNVSTSQIVNLAGITAGPETAQTTTTSVSTSNPTVFTAINVVGTQIQFTLAAGIATPQDVVVTVRVKDNGGVANGGVDSVVRTFKLGIDPMPVAAASPNLITLGATAQLSATGANAVNYTWVAVGGTGIVGSGATINVRPRGTTTYAVVVTNSFGYQATVPVLLTVIVDYKLVPNNLVTPNGDGVNDKWVIPNIDMYPDNEVMVYDKAGRAVFAKRGYNNEWDGTINGKKLKEDAYFYVIKFNKDGALPIRGYVSIVR